VIRALNVGGRVWVDLVAVRECGRRSVGIKGRGNRRSSNYHGDVARGRSSGGVVVVRGSGRIVVDGGNCRGRG
jgi:hypothetical protein